MMRLPNRNWYHKNYVTAEFLYIGASIDMFPDDVMLSCILVTDLARQTDYVPLLDIACFKLSDFLCVSEGKLCVSNIPKTSLELRTSNGRKDLFIFVMSKL